jgi:hypothetical protein
MQIPSLPTQAELDARFAYINTQLQTLLAGDLGQYQLIKGGKVYETLPAIWTEPPMLPTEFKMVEQSGIECIISRDPDIEQYPIFNNGLELYEKYTISLRQYNTSRSTQHAVNKIISSKIFMILDSPRTVPYMQLPTGLVYETSTIQVTVGNWYLRA